MEEGVTFWCELHRPDQREWSGRVHAEKARREPTVLGAGGVPYEFKEPT
jgi:hypothetical protein